jgi:hypothetical protein
MRAASVASAAP